ncbi:MAG: ABC transporter permease [Arthrobacter sp.]|uniref:FtsX-like permease family protein n=1 Tax=Arthrobacter sp. TaxID=1667 RepID=UPI003473C425
MLSLALANLRTYGRRFVAVCLAVMIGTAFLSATLMVGASATASLQRSVGASYQNADLVAAVDWAASDAAAAGGGPSADATVLGPRALEAASAVPGVAAGYGRIQTAARVLSGDDGETALVGGYAAAEALRSVVVTAGALPDDARGIALDTRHAADSGLGLGDSVTLAAPTADGEVGLPVRITGLTAPSDDPGAGAYMQVTAADPLLERILGGSPDYGQLQLLLDDGADPAAVAPAVADALTAAGVAHPAVRTAREQTLEDVASLSGGQDQLTVVLLVFALVALVVTGLVVTNTFSVLVAQRTRELALLRTIGARRAQLRRAVLSEALLVGLASSALGVLLATGLMAALVAVVATLPGSGFAVLAVPVGAVAVGMAAGTAMTLVAAWVPARNATRVAPLAALRPADPARAGNRRGRVRLAAGALLTLVGAALLGIGAAGANLLIAFGGGALSFPGVLLLGSLFLPPAVSAAGRLARPAGVPGRLAALNAVRNPGRTTATASALLIGVTLVSMMMVGAQTAKASLDGALASEYLVDVTVEGHGRDTPLDSGDAGEVLRVDGVAAAALLTPVGTDAGGLPVFAADSGDLAAVLNDASRLPGPGQALVAQDHDGAEVAVGGPNGSATWSAVRTGSNTLRTVTTTGTAAGLMPDAPGSPAPADDPADGPRGGPEDAPEASPVLWIKADADLGAAAARDLGRELAAALGTQEYAVGGGLLEKQLYGEVIDTLLLVVTGLLAVAVLIALIGVANTLSLSVLERTRESSLLRALGLTRRQLRGMLALEATLVAGVAALLGCVLGTAYGILGAQSALGSFAALVVSLPWAQLAGVLLVAVLAALAASVMPARRAARLSPVEGLAAE